LTRALALALAVVAALAGCSSSPRVYFTPSRTRAALVAPAPRDASAPAVGAPAEVATPVETRQFVPEDLAGEEIRIALKAIAFEDAITDRISLPTLRVRIWLYNFSKHVVEVRPGEFEVSDDLDRRFPPPSTEQDGHPAGIVLARPPVRTAVDVIFRLPEGYDPRTPRELRMRWGFRVDDREFRHETILEPGRDGSFRDPFGGVAPRSS
jgi:hypothetical protein